MLKKVETAEHSAPTYSVPPVVRAIKVLRHIADGHSVANQAKAARAIGINRTTLLRLIGGLEVPDTGTVELLGRDVRVAFKETAHEEAYTDAVATVIHDQEEAGARAVAIEFEVDAPGDASGAEVPVTLLVDGVEAARTTVAPRGAGPVQKRFTHVLPRQGGPAVHDVTVRLHPRAAHAKAFRRRHQALVRVELVDRHPSHAPRSVACGHKGCAQ